MRIFLVSLLVAGSAAMSANAKDGLELSFGVYQTDKPTVIHAKFMPLLRHLEESLEEILDVPVGLDIKMYETYDEGLDALVDGEVDFVRFGPASYVLAKKRNHDVSLLAMELYKGKKTFPGVIAVQKNSPIKSLKDLKGKSFAFGDRNSTIGRYLAQSELGKAGIKETDLKSFEYLGRHDLVAARVKVGDFDAGSLKISSFKKANTKGEMRILHEFTNVTKPWIARAGLKPEVHKALSDALIGIEDEKILASFKVTGFTSTTPDDFEVIHDGMVNAEKLFAKRKTPGK